MKALLWICAGIWLTLVCIYLAGGEYERATQIVCSAYIAFEIGRQSRRAPR